MVVINETFARVHWPNASPLGAGVRFGGPTALARTIVGVVKDVRERGYERDMKPGAYVPFEQVLTNWLPESLVVRTKETLPQSRPRFDASLAMWIPSSPFRRSVRWMKSWT